MNKPLGPFSFANAGHPDSYVPRPDRRGPRAPLALNLDTEAEDQFVLGQNSPNPYSDKTTIPFTLVFAADVQLSIFDLLGRKVASILRKALVAGEHGIELNLSGLGLAPGAYVYQLRVTNRLGVYRQSRLMTSN